MDGTTTLWFIGFIIGVAVTACVIFLLAWNDELHDAYKKRKTKKTIAVPLRSKDTYSRDTLWGCNDGRMIKFRDLEDTHVANIIDWTKRTGDPKSKLVKTMQEELKIRGISHKFSDRSQIPYKNQRGKWEIWNFDTNEPMEIEE